MRSLFLIPSVCLSALLSVSLAAQLEMSEKVYVNRPEDAHGCIGGERCGGRDARLRVGLENRAVTEVVFRAHDDVGREHNGTLRVRIDGQVVSDRLSISDRPEEYRLRVENVRGDELIFETVSNDEVEIEAVQIRYAIGGNAGAQTIRCESNDGKSKRCPANTARGVRLLRQLSSSPCRSGSSWGYDRDSIWVSNGCRADFEVASLDIPDPGTGGIETIRCESTGGRRKLCPADTAGGVKLVRKLSDAPCRSGSNWGYDREGIWVSDGCRAEFEIRSSGGTIGWWSPEGSAPSEEADYIRCESADGRQRVCSARTRGGVSLHRQLSSTPCIEGKTWGYDRGAIWVNGGCRAEFKVERESSGGAQLLKCESDGSKQRLCPADTRGGVRLAQQLSKAPCRRNESWGYDRDGIWVRNGCRAVFQIGE
jgi:hypothetical protein